MYCYFCSDFPAIIKINGIYYGNVYNSAKQINIDDEQAFIELCSIDNNESSINLLIDHTLLKRPPDNVMVVNLGENIFFIKFLSCHKKQGFFVLAQEKLPFAVITVFNENGLKLSIETQSDFLAQDLFVNASSVDISHATINNSNLVFISLNSNKKLLYAFNLSSKINQVFCRQIDDFSINQTLQTTERFLDIAKHTLTVTWDFDGNSFIEKSRSISQSESFDLSKLHENLIPYAFLEQFLVGGNIDDYVADNIKENAKMLPNYLGDFVGICPTPPFLNKSGVGLVYNKDKNYYVVEYFLFTIENRKISNVLKQ